MAYKRRRVNFFMYIVKCYRGIKLLFLNYSKLYYSNYFKGNRWNDIRVPYRFFPFKTKLSYTISSNLRVKS